MRLTYVTGVSGAGKTTVGEALAGRATTAIDRDRLRVVDLDDTERPHAAHVEWLRWRAAEHLHEATDLTGTATDRMFVTGIVWPHAVVDCNAWPAAQRAGVQVEFVMLDVPHRVIKARLAERNGGRGKGFRELLRYNRQLASALRHQVEQQRRGHVLAAEHQSPDMLAQWLIQSGPGIDRWPIVGGGHA